MKKKPIISAEEAIVQINNGDTVMVGGFMGVGSPPSLLKALRESKKTGMTLVCCDNGLYLGDTDAATGVALNIVARQFSRIVTSHIGLNKETQKQMISGETEVDLVPQGTLVERIRAAGAGLGGFLTPTGVGTELAEGKIVMKYNNREFLLEHPLHGDVALIQGFRADQAGNLTYHCSARNFCPIMATAGRLVFAEVDEIVEIGMLDPEIIVTPGIFIDALVVTSGKEQK